MKAENEDHIEAKRNAHRLMDEYVALVIARRNCCDPYDCMCHEQCDEEYGYCGMCKRQAEAYRMASDACAFANIDFGDTMRDSSKAVDEERSAYYRETRHDHNAGAHWSDMGGYNAE